MLVFTQHDPIAVMNYVNSNHPEWAGKFSVVLGVSQARNRDDRMLVFESELVVSALTVEVEVVDLNGKVNWARVAEYVDSAHVTTTPHFVVRPNRIAKELAHNDVNPDHALSAMASVFRHDLRPQVIKEIVAFLSDKRVTRFVLPNKLTPQRGKVKALYDKATAHDYSQLKRAIAGHGEDYFEATYWRAVINKHNGGPKPTKRSRER